MKKILIGISVFFGLILAVLVVGLLSISSIVTPDFIVSQIESSLNARADLKKVNISLFSALSSVELENLSLHERDHFADNANLLKERKPSVNSILSVKKVDLKLNFLALLKRNFQLKSFLLIEPSVSIVLKENGNSLTHLFQQPKLVAGQPNPALEIKEDTTTADKSDKPFTVKSLPISANIDKVGMENGTIDIFIQKTLQKISLKNVNLLLTDIDIDPENLEKHNAVHLTANVNCSVLNSGGHETALFKILSKGSIAPFVPKTGLVNPSVNYNLTLKQGSYINGLSIMDALSGNLPVLSNAGIKLDGFSKKADLTSDVNVAINYFSSKITLLNQIIFPTPNYDLTLEKDNWIHLETNEHHFKGSVLASKVESDKTVNGVDSAIKAQMKQGNPLEIRNKILGNLIKNDRVNLPFTSSGNIKSPNVQLAVTLPSILDLAKGLIGEKLKDEIKKKLPAGVEDVINKGLKKLF
jgi:hypothetical protein